MSMIKCPECGNEISDKAENCPNCGYTISPHRGTQKVAIGVIAAICGIIAIFVLIYAVSNFNIAREAYRNAKSTASEEEKTSATKEETRKPAFDFAAATNSELSNLPDQDGLVSLSDTDLKAIMIDIGVKDLTSDATLGNYHESSGTYFLSCLIQTENGTTLMIDYMYISFLSDPKWSIASVSDYYKGIYYYSRSGSESVVDIYDYKTGKRISSASK